MKLLKPAAFVLLAALAVPAFAADQCATTIEGNDAMQYNLKNIDIPKACKQFSVTVKHVGKMQRNVMGHNWVLSRTADMAAVEKDGIAAGLPNEYIKPNDARVIAHTKVVGGGQSDTVKFDVAKLKAGESYSFFCSFPGHAALMKGTIQVK